MDMTCLISDGLLIPAPPTLFPVPLPPDAQYHRRSPHVTKPLPKSALDMAIQEARLDATEGSLASGSPEGRMTGKASGEMNGRSDIRQSVRGDGSGNGGGG